MEHGRVGGRDSTGVTKPVGNGLAGGALGVKLFALRTGEFELGKIAWEKTPGVFRARRALACNRDLP